MNKLKARLKSGKACVNAWLAIPSGFSAEVMAQCGFDSVTVDMQHGVQDYLSMVQCFQAMDKYPITPLVRVPWNEPGIIGKVLDAGAWGVICPMVNTLAEAKALASACLYPPQGKRSNGPIRAAAYGEASPYQSIANDEVLVIPMIETQEAIDNLDAILDVSGISGIYVGPSDLGFSLGILTRLTSRTSLTLSAGKQKSNYDRGIVFRDVELATQLDRESDQAIAAARVSLTPLTTLSIDGSAGRDHMPLRPQAETENFRMNAGVDFAPDAVIRGRAGVGYHVMQPRHTDASNATAGSFSGLTSDVNLSYTLLGVTRFTGNLVRDASFSASPVQPSYVSTRTSLDIVQAIAGPIDLTLRGGREKLAYPATVLAAARNDYANVLGGGLQIRIGSQGTIGLLYDKSDRRSSGGSQFGYKRRRIYTTITYGF